MKEISSMTLDEMRSEIKQYLSCLDKENGYAFISYSHMDCEIVYPKVLEWMRAGYNIYLDVDFENRSSDDNWVDIMEEYIQPNNCKVAICFRSANYYCSYAALLELLTIRGKDTRRNREDVLKMEIVQCDKDSYKTMLDTPEMKEKYINKYKKYVLDMKQEFLSHNKGEAQVLRKGIRFFYEQNKSADFFESKCFEDYEEILDWIKKGFRSGATQFFSNLGELVNNWFIIYGLTGNYKQDISKEQLDKYGIKRDGDAGCEPESTTDTKKEDLNNGSQMVRFVKSSNALKEILLSDECKDVNLKKLVGENKLQIRISDSISYSESYLKYDTWLFSFDKNTEENADKWDFFILKKGELQDEKQECFDATNSGKSVFVQKCITKAHLAEFQRVSLKELLEGEWTDCFVEVVSLGQAEAEQDTKKKAASVTGDITYTLYGKEYTDNQANMMLRVFAQVLKRHPEKIATLPEQQGMNCAMKYEDIKEPGESSAYPSYFRRCENFTFENGESVCIGTAYSSGDKMKKIARLLEICGEDRNIFCSQQIELPEVKSTKETEESKATSNGIKYSIYGESGCGDQTDMMTTICSKIIDKHPEKLQELVDGTLCIGYKDAETMAKTYFRVYREFVCKDVKYVVGTSFGLPGKIKEIEKVLYICGEDVNQVEIEGVELNTAPTARCGRKKAKENFLAE